MSTETTTRWKATADETQREFPALLHSVMQEQAHVTVTEDGTPGAVLVPFAWYQLAEQLIAEKWQEAAATLMRSLTRRPTDPDTEEGR